MDSVVQKNSTLLEQNPSLTRKLCEKALQAARAREAFQEGPGTYPQEKRFRDQQFTRQTGRCTSKDPDECEVFIVEEIRPEVLPNSP